MTDASTLENADRVVIITRTYDAPAHLVFEALSRPEHVIKWFGPKGWPLTMCEMDFRVGGGFRFAMTGPSGVQNTPFGGNYLEIEPDRKIKYDNGFETPGAEKMIVTLTLDEEDGRTLLTMHTLFASVHMHDTHVGYGFEKGTNSGFDNLEDFLRDMTAKG